MNGKFYDTDVKVFGGYTFGSSVRAKGHRNQQRKEEKAINSLLDDIKTLSLLKDETDEYKKLKKVVLDSHFEQLRFVRTTTLEKVKQDIQSLELLSVV